jgi:hypothetical protein
MLGSDIIVGFHPDEFILIIIGYHILYTDMLKILWRNFEFIQTYLKFSCFFDFMSASTRGPCLSGNRERSRELDVREALRTVHHWSHWLIFAFWVPQHLPTSILQRSKTHQTPSELSEITIRPCQVHLPSCFCFSSGLCGLGIWIYSWRFAPSYPNPITTLGVDF